MGKKIGFILKGYPRLSETFIAQEIYLLEQKGFEIEIFSMRKAREVERQPVIDLIKAKVTYIPEYIFDDLKTIFRCNAGSAFRFPMTYSKTLIKALFATMQERDYSPIKRFLQAGWLISNRNLGRSDVKHLHSHFLHVPTEMTYYISQITGLTFSISAHAKDIYTSTKAQIKTRVNASEFLMTCTGFNYDFIQGIDGIHSDKVNKVYHGIDPETFKPAGTPAIEPNKPIRLLSIGRLVEKKGYEHIFNALKILKEQQIDYKYDLYGAGELRDRLIDLRDQLGLSDQIEFCGHATHPELIEKMRGKGIFISGSQTAQNGDRDGIPNTIAEAMSMEMPVVATKVSGIPELIEDGKSGLLVDEKNPSQLANAICSLIKEPNLAHEIGKNARERVEEWFNCQHLINDCVRLLTPYR